MATIGLAFVGGTVGAGGTTATGAALHPMYAKAGMIIGSAIGAWLDGKWLGPETLKAEVPRIDDIRVMDSAYGLPRPFGYGGYRMAGNVIWARAVDSERVDDDSGPVEQVWWEYYATFAVAFGEGNGTSTIRRIWADGKLIWDARRAAPIRLPGLGITIYAGGEDQEPDSLIQAVEGVAGTPAYRGTIYVVFDHMHLKPFGNRIPSIEAEVGYEWTGADNVITTDLITSGEGSPFNDDEYATNKVAVLGSGVRNGTVAYLQVLAPSGDLDKTGLRKIDLNIDHDEWPPQMEQLSDHTCTNMGIGQKLHGDAPMIVGPGRDIYLVGGDDGSGDSSVPIIRIDHVSMEEVGRIGINSGSSRGFEYWSGDWHIDPPGFMMFLRRKSNAYDGDSGFLVVAGDQAGATGKYCGIITTDDMNYLWSTIEDWPGGPYSGDVIHGICHAEYTSEYARFYVITGNPHGSYAAHNLYVYRHTIYHGYDSEVVALPVLVGTITSMEMSGESSTQNEGRGLFYDPRDDTLVFSYDGLTTGAHWIKYDPDTDAILWRGEEVGSVPDTDMHGDQSALSSAEYGRFGYIVGNKMTVIRRMAGPLDSAGSILQDEVVIDHTLTDGVCVYNEFAQCIYGVASADGLVMVPTWRREIPSVLLSNVATDLFERCGLETGDFDVSDLTSLYIVGYAATRPATVRALFEDIAAIYQIDAVEIDGVIVCRRRDETSVFSLVESDLCEVDEGEGAFRETRLHDVDLPASLSIRYIDQENDYQPGSQSGRRVRYPTASMNSNVDGEIDAAMVATASFIRQQIQKIIDGVWDERTAYEFSLPQKQLALDVGDAGTVTMDDGAILSCRIVGNDLGRSFRTVTSAVSQAPAQYSDASTGDAGSGTPNQYMQMYPDLITHVVDMPTPHDQFEPRDRTEFNLSVFVTRAREDDREFQGATIWLKDPNGVWKNMGSVTREWLWGRTVNAGCDFPAATTEEEITQTAGHGTWILEDPPMSYSYVWRNNPRSIKTTMEVGALPPFFPALLESGELRGIANWMYLIYADGEVEMVGFDMYADPTVHFLSRGMRGTDTVAFEHGLEETDPQATVLMAEWVTGGPHPKYPFMVRVPIERLGEDLTLRVVAFNQLFDDAEDIHITPVGRSLMPYAPGAVRGRRVPGILSGQEEYNSDRPVRGFGHILIDWRRRTRCHGEWTDNAEGTPLYEDRERYDLRIYYPDADTLVRTVSSGSIRGTYYAYTELQQNEDGVPLTASSIWVEVAQLSSQVGRGFSRIQEVKLNSV